jgi:hypothetical protein
VCKHISAATNPDNNRRIVVFVWSVPRFCKQGDKVRAVRESVKTGLNPGGRGLAVVGTVTRKCLVTLRTLDCVLWWIVKCRNSENIIVKTCKWSIKSFTNPNPFCSHTYYVTVVLLMRSVPCAFWPLALQLVYVVRRKFSRLPNASMNKPRRNEVG